MKKFLMTLFAALFAFGIYAAAPSGWTTNINTAFAQAKKSNRNVLLLFTGSDWCGYCIKLKSQTLDKAQFKKLAEKNFVLVYFDFPHRTKLDGSQKAIQQHMQAKFKVSEYPTTLILSPQGEELARIVGAPPTESYLRQLQQHVPKKNMSKNKSKKFIYLDDYNVPMEIEDVIYMLEVA
jgi:thioredoxin-related protein